MQPMPQRLFQLVGLLLLLTSSPLRAEPIVLALGDSLTFGYEVAEDKTWPSLLEKKLQANGFPKAKVINAGTSGATSAFGPQTLKFHFKRYTPDLLIYALGANDGLRGLDPKGTEDNIRQAIKMAQAKEVPVLLLGMKAPPNYGKRFPESFEQSFANISKEFELPFIPFFLEGVAGNPKLNQPDGIHPNPAGYKIITETIYAKVKELL
jgi:acyl-CoA thioesterase-1